MSDWTSGRVTGKHQWTEKLFSLQLEADIAPFTAGQFTRLALDMDGERVARPYSFVNAPGERPLEFYFVVIPEGRLSPRLARLEVGDCLWVAKKAGGFFILDEIPPGRELWCLSTGTGLGVFLSILKTEEPWQRFERIILVHGVRQARELTYGDTIQRFTAQHPAQFRMIPLVSREACDFALPGRIPAAIENGTLESRAGIPLDPARSQVMICGNPAMVRDTRAVLEQRGLRRNRRQEPGQITTENYWRAS